MNDTKMEAILLNQWLHIAYLVKNRKSLVMYYTWLGHK